MDAINWHTFFFLLFGLAACVFSVAVVVSANIVRMAFFLIIALGATAGLFFLAGAAFVGAMQLLIYVGGTLVLLIFGVMLTAQGPFISMKTRGGEWVVAAIVGGSLLAVLLQAAFRIEDWRHDPAGALATAITGSASRPDARVVIRATKRGEYVGLPVKFEPVDRLNARASAELAEEALEIKFVDGATASDVKRAVEAAAHEKLRVTFVKGSNGQGEITARDGTQMAIRAPRGDTPAAELGLAFLGFRNEPKKSGYLLPFEIISVHLLVVLIGAAYLARTKKRADQTEG